MKRGGLFWALQAVVPLLLGILVIGYAATNVFAYYDVSQQTAQPSTVVRVVTDSRNPYVRVALSNNRRMNIYEFDASKRYLPGRILQVKISAKDPTLAAAADYGIPWMRSVSILGAGCLACAFGMTIGVVSLRRRRVRAAAHVGSRDPD